MSGWRACLDEPVVGVRGQGGAQEGGATVDDADGRSLEFGVVVDREGSALQRVGSVVVGRADGLGPGLLDADVAGTHGSARLVVGASVVIVGATHRVIEAASGRQVPIVGGALQCGLTVTRGPLVACHIHTDVPGGLGTRFEVRALGEGVGAVARWGGAVEAFQGRGDPDGALLQSRSEGGGVGQSSGGSCQSPVVGGGNAIGDGDVGGESVLDAFDALLDADLGGLLLVGEGAGHRQSLGRGGGGHGGEVDAAGGRVARDVHSVANSVDAGDLRQLPLRGVGIIADWPGSVVAGLAGRDRVPAGNRGSGLGDDELGLSGDEGLVSAQNRPAVAVGGGLEGGVGEGSGTDVGVGLCLVGQGRSLGGLPVASGQGREVEGGNLLAGGSGVLGDVLRDAQESLLTELSVEASEGGLILLRGEGVDGSRTRGRLGGAVAVGAGNEAPEEEAVGDAVNDEGAVRGGLIHGEHVVRFGRVPRNIHVVGVVVRLVGVDVVVAVAGAHVLEAEPGVLPVSADEGVVGCLRGARAGGVRLRVVPVGSTLIRHGGRVVVVGGLVLVEGE